MQQWHLDYARKFIKPDFSKESILPIINICIDEINTALQTCNTNINVEYDKEKNIIVFPDCSIKCKFEEDCFEFLKLNPQNESSILYMGKIKFINGYYIIYDNGTQSKGQYQNIDEDAINHLLDLAINDKKIRK